MVPAAAHCRCTYGLGLSKISGLLTILSRGIIPQKYSPTIIRISASIESSQYFHVIAMLTQNINDLTARRLRYLCGPAPQDWLPADYRSHRIPKLFRRLPSLIENTAGVNLTQIERRLLDNNSPTNRSFCIFLNSLMKVIRLKQGGTCCRRSQLGLHN